MTEYSSALHLAKVFKLLLFLFSFDSTLVVTLTCIYMCL